jgi:hypothetical protein
LRKPLIAVGCEHGLRPSGTADVGVAVAAAGEESAAAALVATAALVAVAAPVLDVHAPASMIAPEPSNIAAPRRRFITDSSIKTVKGMKEAGASPALRFAAVLLLDAEEGLSVTPSSCAAAD